MRLIYSFAVLLVFSAVNLSFSPHGGSTPHGGEVVAASHGYFIEKVHAYKARYFYLLANDEHTTIKDEKLSGTLKIKLKDGSTEEYDLVLSEDLDQLIFEFAGRKRIREYRISVSYGGKIIEAYFEF